ncbi:sex determination protein fruitless-like [Palaemon carinicauda]|uniref:sex determination protein fruitless-like n=1 Tax=Palaemon carinicauda TaxID=392227 RepID=UPI0035B5E52E
MGDQCFCLRWNNYQSSMVGVLRSLLEEGQFVDVTLACDGRRLKAHKLMLSACSNFFRQLLKENPSDHPIIFLRDVRFWELESIMDFIYNGQVNVMQEQLPGFIRTAEALQIKGLAAVNNNNNTLRINPYIGDHISRLQEMYVGGGIGGEVGGEAYQPPPLKRPRRPPPAHSLPPRSENSSTIMKGHLEEMTIKATTITALNQSSAKSQASSQDGPEGSGLESNSGVSTTGSSAMSPATASGASPSTRAASPRGVATEKTSLSLKSEDEVPLPDGESESEFSNHDRSNLGVDSFKEIDWPSGENLSPLPLNYNKGGYPVCKVCGKVFKHQGSLVAHYQVHQLRTKCPVCRKVLSRHYHMKVHLLTVHKVPDAEIEGLLRSQNIV